MKVTELLPLKVYMYSSTLNCQQQPSAEGLLLSCLETRTYGLSRIMPAV